MDEEKRDNRGDLPDGPEEGRERQIASAFDWRGELPRLEPPRSARPSGAWRYPAVLILSALLAVSLLVFSLVASVRYASEGGGAAETEQTSEPEVREKIVYVRELTEDSGILTTPELYSQCADSVVSVLTESEGGSGVGSGFFVSSDGYIATAYHVVEGASRIEVTLADGRSYPAHRVGGNGLTDLALLKIEERGLPAVTFGESESLLVGERVVAIGTPASPDYAGSVCSGEISYLGRRVRILDGTTGALQKTVTVIQTDAALNPGNSGCPLFDGYGRVIGMVTMKLGEDYAGIGFAIPSDGAQAILMAMMEGREPDESLLWTVAEPAPRLGILGERASESGVFGVRIHGFGSGSSSAAVMLKEGDLILRIDGTPVTAEEELRSVIESHRIGDTVAVTVLRSGQTLTFEVTLGEE